MEKNLRNLPFPARSVVNAIFLSVSITPHIPKPAIKSKRFVVELLRVSGRIVDRTGKIFSFVNLRPSADKEVFD
jgi:hypothetical protein